MGVDLISLRGKEDNDIHFNWAGWTYVTRLAVQYGWNPAGTKQEPFEAQDITTGEVTTIKPDPKWEGGYHSNDGQLVTDEDARAMAEALKKALPDEEKEVDNNEYWIPKLKSFIEFLNNGEFRIL